MRAPEHAPRGPFRLLERRHGLAKIVEGGSGILETRHWAFLRFSPLTLVVAGCGLLGVVFLLSFKALGLSLIHI